MWTLVQRVIREDGGQDLVEYALLVALVAVVSAVALGSLQDALKTTYESWDTGNQNLWIMPPPAGGS